MPSPVEKSASGRRPNRSTSIDWLSNVLAAVAAFFFTPLAYRWSVSSVEAFTARQYGNELVDLVSVAWFVLLAAGLFFFSRGVSAGGLRLLSGLIATRVF